LNFAMRNTIRQKKYKDTGNKIQGQVQVGLRQDHC
jgi:hypothetical protein